MKKISVFVQRYLGISIFVMGAKHLLPGIQNCTRVKHLQIFSPNAQSFTMAEAFDGI